MSFSFSAAGDKQQALSSLESANVYDNEIGEQAREFGKQVIENSKTEPTATQDVRYLYNASGHSYESGLESLTISFSTSLVPKPE